MQAIRTRFKGPTNSRGARIIADCDARRITVSWDYSLSTIENHREAAAELAKRLDWLDGYELASGGLSDCWVHVLIAKRGE